MSQSTTCQSFQYKAIQNLYDDLVQAISSEIQTLLPKAWSKKIIGKQHLDSSLELSTTAHQKAIAFMSAIVSRIELDSNAFDVFLSLLKEVESLEYMKERLEEEVAKLQRESASHILSDDITDVESDTQQLLPNLDPSEEIELITPEGNSDLERMVVQEAHDIRQGEEGRHYTAEEIRVLKKRLFSLGCTYTALLVLIVSMYIVGTVGIGLGARMIAGVNNDCKSVLITINGQTQPITLDAGFGAFVLLVGVCLNFIATFFALLTPYCYCRLFGKCQHRGWSVILCIDAPLGICAMFIVLGTVVYYVIVSVAFYTLAQQEFEIPDCFRIHYYSTFVFLLITHVVVAVIAAVCLIAFLIKFIIFLIKSTICSNGNGDSLSHSV